MVMNGRKRSRFIHQKGKYHLVTGFYPRETIKETFASLEETIRYAIPRIHLDEGAYNYIRFLLGTKPSIAVSEVGMMEWGADCQKSESYLNKSVTRLLNSVKSGNNWLSDKL